MIRRDFRRAARFFASMALTAAVLSSISACDARAGDDGKSLGIAKEKPREGQFVETDKGFMVPYTAKIPGSDVTYEMTPIPGGTFMFGSPKGEKNRGDDEGPQFQVKVEPFWMSRYELTWAEYKKFMDVYQTFTQLKEWRNTIAYTGDNKNALQRKEELVNLLTDQLTLRAKLRAAQLPADGITAPTELYDPSTTFQNGEEPSQPAVTMTQYAARQYTKWLSGITGRIYRLPSEAEWEYAARAGSTAAYFFGDDPAKLSDYAWFEDNSDATTHPVGELKPNPWGLYDIYGNVAEWTLDEHDPKTFAQFAGKTVSALDTVRWPTRDDGRSLRGGFYEQGAAACRSARRMKSDLAVWKYEDPNIPKSPWWYTDDPTQGVGFRIVRPLAEPSPEMKEKFWNHDAPSVLKDVKTRIKMGRGIAGFVDADFAKLLEEMEEFIQLRDDAP